MGETETNVEFIPTTMKEMLLYKMDRTIAIVGIVVLGCWAMISKDVAPTIQQITTAAITALATYVGGRTGK